MSEKLLYFITTSIRALIYSKDVNKSFLMRCIAMIETDNSRGPTFTTNISKVLSKAAFINLYMSISSPYLTLSIHFAMIYFLLLSFLLSNLTSTLVGARKSIHKTTLILISVSKKIFLKNRYFLDYLEEKTPPRSYHIF